MNAQPDDNYGLIVRHVARGFTRVLQDELAGAGITAGEYRVLRAIEEGPGIQSEIAQLAAMDRPFVTATVRRLIAKGHVLSRPNARDRRRTDLRLTASGRRLVAKISANIIAASTAVATEGIAARDLRVFVNVSRRMIANFERAHATPKGGGS